MKSLLTLITLFYAIITVHAAKKVAIIGSGAGGSSASRFLQDSFGKNVDVTVFEKSEEIGGRMKTINVAGINVEIGAGVYHKENHYVRNFSLYEAKFAEKRMLEVGDRLGVWDGKEFRFQSSSYQVLSLLRVLWRYGLAPFRVDEPATETKNNFVKLYDQFKNGATFQDVQSFVNQTFKDFDLMSTSLNESLSKRGISQAYVDEIVTCLTRINYGQSTAIAALPGFVALVGSGDDIAAPVDGMQSICESALKNSGANLKLSTKVNKISLVSSEGAPPSYKLSFDEKGVQSEETYDAVIISSPLEFANIEIENVPLPEKALMKRAFQTTYVTIIAGTRNKQYFGLGEDESLPSLIGTVENDDIPFTSLSLKEADNSTFVYKIFSRKPVSDILLDRLFVNKTFVYRHHWPNAYPILKPTQEFPPIVFHDNLFYGNAMESTISCIELSMVSSRNIVNILSKNWKELSNWKFDGVNQPHNAQKSEL